ncbi:MAG: hypothetical protein IPM59_12950 [Chloracidobacterium sp.]|nr:hypothetical protein [Chloracidobacterium sp.]
MRIETFHQVISDYALYRDLIGDVIKRCLYSLKHRESMVGVDTVILRAAEEPETLKSTDDLRPPTNDYRTYHRPDPSAQPVFDAEHFWPIYRAMGDEFDRHFSAIDLQNLAIFLQSNFRFFLVEVWQNYLLREVDSIIRAEPEFPMLIAKLVCYPEHSMELSERATDILQSRYGDS